MVRLTFSTKIILGLAVITLTIGYFSLLKNERGERRSHDGSDILVCDSTAMRCPNGSIVGLEPNTCTFQKCPNSAQGDDINDRQNTPPLTLVEMLPENGCVSVGRYPSSADVVAALTPAMDAELRSYLNDDWRIIQVCRDDTAYALALFSEQRSRHLKPGDDPERIPANNLLVAFPKLSGNASAYKAERFNPNSGDYGTCEITTLSASYLSFDCGGGDGPGGWRKSFQLNFNGSGAILQSDCVYHEGVETCR